MRCQFSHVHLPNQDQESRMVHMINAVFFVLDIRLQAEARVLQFQVSERNRPQQQRKATGPIHKCSIINGGKI
jgi:phosphopantetheinyl transferase